MNELFQENYSFFVKFKKCVYQALTSSVNVTNVAKNSSIIRELVYSE
jgi:hypothetical protein